MISARLAYLCSLAGLFVTFALTYARGVGRHMTCGESDDCGKVAASAWASVGPVPTSALGLIGFFTLAVLLARFLGRQEVEARQAAFAFASLFAVINLVFSGYAHFVVHAHCLWCLSANLLYGLVALFTSGAMPEVVPLTRGGWLALPAGALAMACLGDVLVTTPLKTTGESISAGWFGTDRSLDEDKLADAADEALAPADSLQTDRSDSPGMTVVLFVDLECPYSKGALQDVFEAYDEKPFHFVIRHFPLAKHPQAPYLAKLAEAAKARGVGMEFLRKAAVGEDNARLAEFVKHAGDLGKYEAKVDLDRQYGSSLGIHETPVVLLLRDGKPRAYSTSFRKLMGLAEKK